MVVELGPAVATAVPDMAVVTVGYIQAGTKNNIIPDQAELGLGQYPSDRNSRVRYTSSIFCFAF